MNQIPSKLINYRVYEQGEDYLGVANVDLPSIELLTETIKGAGIAGEVNSPVLGHFASMTLTVNWNTVNKHSISLFSQKAHDLDFRGAQQVYNAGTGQYKTSALRVVARCVPTKASIGKLETGAKTDTSNEFEVHYLKISIDDKVLVEIDKFNYICVIDGVDYLKDVRQALGL